MKIHKNISDHRFRTRTLLPYTWHESKYACKIDINKNISLGTGHIIYRPVYRADAPCHATHTHTHATLCISSRIELNIINGRYTHLYRTIHIYYISIGSEIKTNGPNIDRYYGHTYTQYSNIKLYELHTRCGVLEHVLAIRIHHTHTQTQFHTYYINLIKYDMCVPSLLPFYIFRLLSYAYVTSARARTFPFGNRHRERRQQ